MTEHPASETADLAAAFERHRTYLRTVALRMVGSGDDADDAVQETWLRARACGPRGTKLWGRR
jgi:DNA-directed RNA polymerase specialized sigma24 family protein